MVNLLEHHTHPRIVSEMNVLAEAKAVAAGKEQKTVARGII